ncbi:MAG: UDP-3-O-[3-hydroxymyristoyl] N-acetylglucosamine deacetylase [Acidobacteria bacterium]|nr:UDP-3-O-[3-hydroxymyristoyl] N-acetylglucosamine deacetylase [Acidobacteriota bacterium]
MTRARHPQTLQGAVSVSGRGLHGNRPCSVRLVPVSQASGLRFIHLPSATEIPVHASRAGDLQLATTLVSHGIRLQTVEHLLSALNGLEVEHLRIEVDGEELPILDGSAAPWVEAIQAAGVQTLPGQRRFIQVLKPVEVGDGARGVRVSPFPGLRIRYTIEFEHPAIGRQTREMSLSPSKYRAELAAARTFCLAHEVEWMQARGLALGGSLENAVVFGPQGPLNPEALRFQDEAVRHKMLDLVGDLSLLGAPLLGLVEAHAAGHALHVALTQKLLAEPGAWAWSEAPEPSRVRPFPALVHHPVPA